MTRTAVQELQARRRAQGDTVASPAESRSPSADAARLEALKKGLLIDLRTAADQELQVAQSALKEASGIAWTGFLGLPMFIAAEVADYRRWSSVKQMIEDGQKSLASGDATFVDDLKRRAYASAWSSARLAQSAILREAGAGKTGVMVALKEEVAAAPPVLTETARAASKKIEDVADGVGSMVKVALVGLTIYAGVKIVEGMRG